MARNESSLHLGLKEWYAVSGDRFEVILDDYIIDIVRDDTLIEIQTKNFAAISDKLKKLSDKYKIILVHPIAREKYIIKTKDDGQVISRRKSPKKGDISDLFNELIRIPELINVDNFSIEVLFTIEEEIRCDDGKGSWRRKGVSIVDRKLISVLENKVFKCKEDFLDLIPESLPEHFTNRDLQRELQISIYKARKMSYCLRKMGLAKQVGKKGNEIIIELEK